LDKKKTGDYVVVKLEKCSNKSQRLYINFKSSHENNIVYLNILITFAMFYNNF